jgi:hypothetical protein
MPSRSLKAKSQENIESADLLVVKGYFNASVHCSYYSCLQLIKLALNEKAHIDFVTQYQESKKSGQSHHYYLGKFVAHFKNGVLSREVERQTNEIKKLKLLRVQADYDPEQVDALNSRRAVSTAIAFSEFIFKDIKIRV